jgi:hypothetical protein
LAVELDFADDEECDDDDWDILDRCTSLSVHIEIGETHERDKFSYEIPCRVEKKKNTVYGKHRKQFDFEFKMNHIKQTVRVEISGKFLHKNPRSSTSGDTYQKSICKLILLSKPV